METSFLAHRSGRIFNPTTLDGEHRDSPKASDDRTLRLTASMPLPVDNWYEDREQGTDGECGGILFPTSIEKGYNVSASALDKSQNARGSHHL
jgi:hypothetical protein